MRAIYKKKQARNLRREMTEAEKRIWHYLRNRQFCGVKFRRQFPIGPYIADFACLEPPVVIELDGGQHAERQIYDARREKFLKQRGFTVFRFWNNDALENTEGVLTMVMEYINSPSPACLRAVALRQAPSPVNGRGNKRIASSHG